MFPLPISGKTASKIGFCWLFLLPPVESVESVLVVYENYINDIMYIYIHTLYMEVSSISWAIPAQLPGSYGEIPGLQSQGIN